MKSRAFFLALLTFVCLSTIPLMLGQEALPKEVEDQGVHFSGTCAADAAKAVAVEWNDVTACSLEDCKDIAYFVCGLQGKRVGGGYFFAADKYCTFYCC